MEVHSDNFLKVVAADPNGSNPEENKFDVIYYPVGEEFIGKLTRSMNTSAGPKEFYSMINAIPNLHGGIGFSELVTGFEVYLDGSYSEETLKRFPVLRVEY